MVARTYAETLHRTVPDKARTVIDEMAGKLGVSGPTLAVAISAWHEISALPKNEQVKALAVLVGLANR